MNDRLQSSAARHQTLIYCNPPSRIANGNVKRNVIPKRLTFGHLKAAQYGNAVYFGTDRFGVIEKTEDPVIQYPTAIGSHPAVFAGT